MQQKGKEQPFTLFYGSQRRTKILNAMMANDKQSKKEGGVILENYRKQLNDKMKREK